MNTKNNFPQFPAYACEGDSIQWEKGEFTLTARIVQDDDAKPTDYECYAPEDVQRWKDDEWFYCGVVLSVSLKGIELDDHAASRWAIDCNYGADNTYLSEVAQELEGEALEAAHASIERIREALKGV